MSGPDPRLLDLIARSGPGHHQAFLEVDGWDPEWPIWCADYFRGPIRGSSREESPGAKLAYLLVMADREWPEGADRAQHLAGMLAGEATAGSTHRTHTFG